MDCPGKASSISAAGSGLHSLAALKLGARSIVAIDIDENSVATTRELLTRLAPPDWRTEIKSAFDLDPSDGTFDVIYSWASCTTPTTCGARSRRPHVWFARR
jgi:2-polyprenyl-6-hydroxyphenyl methylase/3-demethylubiquinone-9 3-methyltransferase